MSTQTIRVPAWQPWLVCFSATLFFFFEFLQNNTFNALAAPLFATFDMSAVTMSRIWFGYNLANIFFLLPAGIVLDRFSTRRLILAAMTMSVLCTLGMSQATATWQLFVFRFLTGIAGSFCLLSCVRIASRWFAPRHMALVVGLMVTFAMSGGLLAQTPFTMLVGAVGWRLALAVDGLLGIVLLFIIWRFVEDYPRAEAGMIADQQQHLHQEGFWPALFSVMRNAQNWLAGLYTSLMNLPIFILGALWGGLYLSQVHGLAPQQASYVTSMIFLGTMVGSPVMGWISDSLRRRRIVMALGALAALVALLCLMYVPALTMAQLMGLFFLIGFITSTQVISYPLIAESNPASLTGTAEGLAATLIMGGGFATTIFAWAINWHWSQRVIANIPQYTLENYREGFWIMPIGFAVAFIAVLLIRETYCRAFNPEEEVDIQPWP